MMKENFPNRTGQDFAKIPFGDIIRGMLIHLKGCLFRERVLHQFFKNLPDAKRFPTQWDFDEAFRDCFSFSMMGYLIVDRGDHADFYWVSDNNGVLASTVRVLTERGTLPQYESVLRELAEKFKVFSADSIRKLS